MMPLTTHQGSNDSRKTPASAPPELEQDVQALILEQIDAAIDGHLTGDERRLMHEALCAVRGRYEWRAGSVLRIVEIAMRHLSQSHAAFVAGAVMHIAAGGITRGRDKHTDDARSARLSVIADCWPLMADDAQRHFADLAAAVADQSACHATRVRSAFRQFLGTACNPSDLAYIAKAATDLLLQQTGRGAQ